jgi:large subunit ribosomal protein L39e
MGQCNRAEVVRWQSKTVDSLPAWAKAERVKRAGSQEQVGSPKLEAHTFFEMQKRTKIPQKVFHFFSQSCLLPLVCRRHRPTTAAVRERQRSSVCIVHCNNGSSRISWSFTLVTAHPRPHPSIAAILYFKLPASPCLFVPTHQPAHKTFRIKRILGKKQRQNRPIPQWIRMRTDNTIRFVFFNKISSNSSPKQCSDVPPKPVCVSSVPLIGHIGLFYIFVLILSYNSKRRHWRRTKMGL